MSTASGDGRPEDPYPPYGQPAYPPAYPPPHGQQPYGPGYPPYPPPPSHGLAVAAMVVGIVSLVLTCGYGVGLLGSPVAWWLGARAKREIDASGGRLGGRGMAQAGLVLGIVGTVLLVVAVLGVVTLVALVGTGSVGFLDGSTSP